MAYPPLGLQLGIFNGHFDMTTQMDAVLGAAAQAGYTAIEGSLPGSTDAAQLLHEQVTAHGLTFAGPHVTSSTLQNVPLIIEQMRILKGTECLQFRPCALERPLNCRLRRSHHSVQQRRPGTARRGHSPALSSPRF